MYSTCTQVVTFSVHAYKHTYLCLFLSISLLCRLYYNERYVNKLLCTPNFHNHTFSRSIWRQLWYSQFCWDTNSSLCLCSSLWSIFLACSDSYCNKICVHAYQSIKPRKYLSMHWSTCRWIVVLATFFPFRWYDLYDEGQTTVARRTYLVSKHKDVTPCIIYS